MIKIYPNTKIFISCPANFASGGPELLHQLAYRLKYDFQVESFMYYYRFNAGIFNSPVDSAYAIYNIPYVLDIPADEDIQTNVLIVPETSYSMELFSKYKNIRRIIWFLSVDNYYTSKVKKSDFFFFRLMNKISKILMNKPLLEFEITSQNLLNKLKVKYDYRKDPLLRYVHVFLSQSHYALYHFNDLKPHYYLSDYINPNFLNIEVDLTQKQDIVAYNPKKGFSFTKKIIATAKNIEFVPLANMSREKVINTLMKAKVYIDFGNHPGKDRIPREAAILGCCVITNKRGSAAYFEDVPIPDEYKFDNQDKNIPQIIEMIRDCFTHYEDRYKDFDYYRSIIRKEPEEFVKDLSKIFVRVND